jgi:glycopeptide antibiotics resistance protein
VSRGWRWLLVLGYAVVIAMLTLTPRRGASGPLATNWTPFASLADLLSGSTTHAAVVNNLLGNLLLFAPLALLLRLLLLQSARWTLAAVLLCSCGVELLQGLGLPDGRQADVDDVLLNVLGAGLALLLVPRGRRLPARSTPS